MTILVDHENCSNCKYSNSEHEFCFIREEVIENYCWTYCVNHPFFNKNAVITAMGPMYNYGPNHSERRVIVKSPDNQAVKDGLLEQANKIKEVIDYHVIDLERDEVIVWQLGEFREKRAIELLEKIQEFNEKVEVTPPVQVANCTRKSLINMASQALEKITKNKIDSTDEIWQSLFPNY